MGDFHADEAHVIRNFVAGVTFEQGDDFVERGAEREVGTLKKLGLEPFGAEQFAVALDVVNTVGKKDKAVAGEEFGDGGLVLGVIEEAEGWVGLN